ncbi:hypothetical protein ON010_g16885 [Phytophthora cinnamomi]|nr:hypothetical protein ON010_g16885 [Phytophthora cinnamomi]
MNGFELAGQPLKVGKASEAAMLINLATSQDKVVRDGPGATADGANGIAQEPKKTATFAEDDVEGVKDVADGGEKCCLCLMNLVNRGEVDDELEDEVRGECGKFGNVKKVEIHELADHVRVFVLFDDTVGANKARQALHGRFFGGNQVQAHYYPPGELEQQRYTSGFLLGTQGHRERERCRKREGDGWSSLCFAAVCVVHAAVAVAVARARRPAPTARATVREIERGTEGLGPRAADSRRVEESGHLGDDVLVARQVRVALGAAEDARAVHELLEDAPHRLVLLFSGLKRSVVWCTPLDVEAEVARWICPCWRLPSLCPIGDYASHVIATKSQLVELLRGRSRAPGKSSFNFGDNMFLRDDLELSPPDPAAPPDWRYGPTMDIHARSPSS